MSDDCMHHLMLFKHQHGCSSNKGYNLSDDLMIKHGRDRDNALSSRGTFKW